MKKIREGKLVIEFMQKPEEIIVFWMKNANTNQTNNKKIEEVEFE